jgi:predicted RNase H-like HicB family nuclease
VHEGSAVRVWLDAGYDGGRYAAWLLDHPGAMTWRATREAAIAAAPGALTGHLAWLADHGETALPASPEPGSEPVVIEEVPSTTLEGRERQAVFLADRRAVGADDLATASRRLGWARGDLLALLPGVLAAAEGDGAPALEGADALGPDGRPESPVVAVVRHLADAEVWLAGRLDPGARYGGPGRVDPLGDHLAGSRAWALEQLERYRAADPVFERADRGGEIWTLAKVIRRMLAHSLDHLAELERRLPAGRPE